MKYKIEQRIPIHISRKEANFDRACDSARHMALSYFGCDDDGYLTNVEDSVRSRDFVVLILLKYQASFSMAGCSHDYFFEAWVTNNE